MPADKVSVITAVLNKRDCIEGCIKSILSQTHKKIEHIIIDGGSTDGTIDIVNTYRDKIAKVVSEKDNGLYEALNKGIKSATGDIICFLNADDIYGYDKAVEDAVSAINAHGVDSAYGDLVYVSHRHPEKIVRFWRSSTCSDNKIRLGWMPPHPTFFVKKNVYDRFGSFDPSFAIAADYEIMLRFLYKNKISSRYINKVLVKMRLGGKSNGSLRRILTKSYEDYKICKAYRLGPLALLCKNVFKLSQFFTRPARNDKN